jgi:hypothetical protein
MKRCGCAFIEALIDHGNLLQNLDRPLEALASDDAALAKNPAGPIF